MRKLIVKVVLCLVTMFIGLGAAVGQTTTLRLDHESSTAFNLWVVHETNSGLVVETICSSGGWLETDIGWNFRVASWLNLLLMDGFVVDGGRVQQMVPIAIALINAGHISGEMWHMFFWDFTAEYPSIYVRYLLTYRGFGTFFEGTFLDEDLGMKVVGGVASGNITKDLGFQVMFGSQLTEYDLSYRLSLLYSF